LIWTRSRPYLMRSSRPQFTKPILSIVQIADGDPSEQPSPESSRPSRGLTDHYEVPKKREPAAASRQVEIAAAVRPLSSATPAAVPCEPAHAAPATTPSGGARRSQSGLRARLMALLPPVAHWFQGTAQSSTEVGPPRSGAAYFFEGATAPAVPEGAVNPLFAHHTHSEAAAAAAGAFRRGIADPPSPLRRATVKLFPRARPALGDAAVAPTAPRATPDDAVLAWAGLSLTASSQRPSSPQLLLLPHSGPRECCPLVQPQQRERRRPSYAPAGRGWGAEAVAPS